MAIIDGKQIAQKVHAETRWVVEELEEMGILPGLAVVLVGEDPASQSYVRAKDRKAVELGIQSFKHELPESISQELVQELVQKLNADSAVHGILVQSPLPKHIDEAAIVAAIDSRKDVDGFHPVNVAKLAMGDATGFVPCTPLGCQRLLLESGIDTKGKHVVILGRSMIVGKPLALLLMAKGRGGDATVTVAHSRSRNLPEVARSADILISAIGMPNFVTADFVKEGAVVIDVGINRVDGKIVGDVAFDEVAPRCSYITPVPGGVGPMTIAMLMANTVKACRQLTGA